MVLAVLLALVLGVTIAVSVLRQDPGITTDCTAYGLAADDPRAEAPEIKLLAADGSPRDESRPVAVTEADPNWGESADGVLLGQQFTAENTRSRYHLFTRGVDFDEPVGLLVRLHGDGASEYYHPDGLTNCLAVIAASHNMLTLVPRTPDTATQTWWEDIPTTQPWLRALVAQVGAEHGVERGNIWWMGYSGGAELLSYGLIPDAPRLITGGAMLLGGGGAPTETAMTIPWHLREEMYLHWITGRRDDGTDPSAPFDAIAAAEEGAAWYRAHGFQNVHTDFPEEHDHFSLPQGRILAEILDATAASGR